MKLVTFDAGNGPRLGVLVSETVIDLAEASNGELPADMRSFLEMGDAALQKAQSIANGVSGKGKSLSDVKLMAPVFNPSKVIAIGLNYMDHCREQGIEPPKRPTTFTKFPSSIIGPGD